MASRPPPFAHHAWLGFDIRVPAGGRPVTICTHGRAFAIGIVLEGSISLRWVTRGREARWVERVGTVHFLPADDERHTFVLKSDDGCRLRAFLIPRGLFEVTGTATGGGVPSAWNHILAVDDPVLRDCMLRLSLADPSACGRPHEGLEETACRLIARLNGGSAASQTTDTSTFDRRMMGYLVDYIDAHLVIVPSLGDMAAIAGLSPSHFARKFRQSTGLSLHRFINHRRVARSFERLQGGTDSLASIALDLGFSSQSHFTRLFHGLTGMTPAKVRKQVFLGGGVAPSRGP